MALYKRGNVWWLEFVPKGGKKVRESTGKSEREEAQAIHDERKRQIMEGIAERPTWDVAVERWMRERTDKRSLHSDRAIAEWLTTHWHGRLLDAISDVDVEKVLELKKEATSASTANHYLAFTRALFNTAKKWKWTSRKLEVEKYKVDNARVRFLSEEELARLMAELPPHLKAMAVFTLMTGLRQANVTGLKWEKVDLKRKIAWVDASEYKNKRQHGVPLNDRAIEILLEQEGKHPTHVFTYRGKPVRSPCKKAWSKALKRADIIDFRWHDLRHTFASYHAMNGTPMLALKALGGWRNLNMVDRYAHLSAENTRQWANNVRIA